MSAHREVGVRSTCIALRVHRIPESLTIPAYRFHARRTPRFTKYVVPVMISKC